MSQAKPCIEYDPACVECRRDAGKDAAGTTWQCVGHVCLERDALRELMNVYNIGGWTDALVPVQRALKAEAERDAALVERDTANYRADANWRRVGELEAERDAAQEDTSRIQDRADGYVAEIAVLKHVNETNWALLTESRRVLRLAKSAIDDLAAQQAMPDDFYLGTLEQIATVLAQEDQP